MKIVIGSIAAAAVVLTSAVASAQSERRGHRAQAMHPEIARMIKSNSTIPVVPNLYLYEWRQTLDTHSGVPQGISGSSLANPWVNRQQYMPGTAMRRW